jgi:hypothetical protein
MIENLPTNAERYAEQADRAAPEQSRLSMAWHLDPVTGKPAARWVSAVEATVAQPLAKAA